MFMTTPWEFIPMFVIYIILNFDKLNQECYFVVVLRDQRRNLSNKYYQIFSENMKLNFIEDLPKNEISRRLLVKIFMRSQFRREIYLFCLEDLTKIL